MKLERHIPEQDVDNNGNVLTYCSVCNKDWGYYNTKNKLLMFKIFIHSLRFKIK